MTRRSIAAATLTLLLTGCGLDAATGREYTPAHGVNNQDGDLDILGAVIVSDSDGSGTLVTSLANNTDDPLALTSVGPMAPEAVTVSPFAAVTLDGGQLLNLAEISPIALTGDFVAGDFVRLVFTFSDGEQVSANIPVVNDDGIWDGLDTAEPALLPAEG